MNGGVFGDITFQATLITVGDIREYVKLLDEYQIADEHFILNESTIIVKLRGNVTTIQCGCYVPYTTQYRNDALVTLHECDE